MTLKKEELPTDKEVVVGLIDRVLQNLKDDKEGTQLAQLRSLIRRQVPLLQRPLFMAYLLKSLLPAGAVGVPTAQPQDTAGRAFAGREALPAQGRPGPAPRRPGPSPGRGGAGEGFPRKVCPEHRGSAVTR